MYGASPPGYRAVRQSMSVYIHVSLWSRPRPEHTCRPSSVHNILLMPASLLRRPGWAENLGFLGLPARGY